MFLNSVPGMILEKERYKVSIIIPFYNAEDYLRKCLDSLFNQTLDSLEYIFVDDSSNDRGHIVLREYLKENGKDKDQNIKIITHYINKGSSSARNSGLKAASGQYIGWVDADDWVEPTMFESLYTSTLSDDYDMVSCNYFINFPNEEKIVIQKYCSPKEFMISLLNKDCEGMLWNKLFKNEIIKANGISFLDNFNMAEDRNFLFKYLYYTTRSFHVDIPLYHYSQYSSSAMTRNYSLKRITDEIVNDSDVLEFIKNENIKFIDNSAIYKFLFNSKKRLLFSININDIKYWLTIFSESNTPKNISSLSFQHKWIAKNALKKRWWFISILLFIKKLINLFK
jgi:glycosyltransferase involved in cell wall biosynthesis